MGISDRFRTSGGVDPTAVMGRRIIAWLLDSLLASIVTLLVHRGDVAFSTDDGLSINPSVIWTLTILMVLNHVALTMTTGFSAGKAVTGLRVVRRVDGGLPGFRGAACRTLPWIVPIPFIPLVEAGMMLSTRGHRRIGDRLGGTMVVDRGWIGEPIVVPGLDDPATDRDPDGHTDGSAGGDPGPILD
jgi:uncharacterized RDD family membrane protein YckC